MAFIATLLPAVSLAALLNLDRQAFGHSMLSRPLVTGFLLGLFLGQPGAGLWLGLTTELLWLAALPLGGQITPNGGLAVSAVLIGWAVSPFSGAGALAETPGLTGQAGLVMAFFLAPFWARTLTVVDWLVRRRALSRLAMAEARLADGLDPKFFSLNFDGFLATLVLGFAALLAAAGVSAGLFRLAALIPPWLLFILGRLYNYVPLLGLAAMAIFLPPKIVKYYMAGLVASLLALSAV